VCVREMERERENVGSERRGEERRGEERRGEERRREESERATRVRVHTRRTALLSCSGSGYMKSIIDKLL
jgi:hypothetical protein